jgi:hypothetical protein
MEQTLDRSTAPERTLGQTFGAILRWLLLFRGRHGFLPSNSMPAKSFSTSEQQVRPSPL